MPKERIKSIDILRVISILAVILIHTTTRTLEASKYNLVGFPLSIFLNQIARFAVPLFFIISGFVLEIGWKDGLNYFQFIKKRLSRVFVPFVFWSGIYYLFVYNQNHENFVQVLLKGDASYQLYFIPTLCIFYLVFPLLHKIIKFVSNKWVLILLTILQSLLLYHDYFVSTFRYPDPIHIAIIGWLFFVIGIVAAKSKDRILFFVQKWKYIVFSGTALSGLYVFWEGRSRFLMTGNYFNFYSQWRPSVLVYTILIGLALFYIFNKEHSFTFLENLSKYSFFVFFVHVIVLEKLWSLFGKNMFDVMSQNLVGKAFFDAMFFFVVVLVSFFIAYLLRKIPRLDKLTG